MIGPPTKSIIDRLIAGTLRPLVLNLYSPEIGYSVVFPASDGRKWTTRCFSYDDELELLDDIENNRLPLFLIDLIDRYCTNPEKGGSSNIFFQGCIGVEIRDFRKRDGNREGAEKKHDVSYAVLRPTAATLLNDLENLQHRYSVMERRKEMDSLRENPTCMETADDVFNRQSRFDNQRLTLESDFWRLVGSSGSYHIPNGQECGKADRRYRRNLRYDVLARRRRQDGLRLEQQFPITQWVINNVSPGQCKQTLVNLTASPSSAATSQWKPMIPSAVKTPLDIAERRQQRAKMQMEQQQGDCEQEGMELMEEYLVEMPSSKFKTHTRIRIYKRCLDAVFVGQLRVERETQTEQSEVQEQPAEATECSFLLGTETASRSYIRQYLDMVSEGGRRPLSLTRRVPGKPPQAMPNAARAVGGVTAISCPAQAPVVIPLQGQFVPLA